MIYAIQSIYSIYKTVKRAEPNFDPPSYLIVTYLPPRPSSPRVLTWYFSSYRPEKCWPGSFSSQTIPLAAHPYLP